MEIFSITRVDYVFIFIYRMDASKEQRRVGIIGTGDFARALAKRLFFSGYDVIIGSRNPSQAHMSIVDQCLCNVEIASVAECIKTTDVMFLAIHAENYRDFCQKHGELLRNKVLIDVSNRTRPSKTHSNAEHLKSLVPSSSVVKAFNVISAYAMENDYSTASKRVFIAGEDIEARNIVANIARDMNFLPVDFGGIWAARRIEAHPLRLFPEWRGPIGFATGVFNVWLLFLIYKYYIVKDAYAWEQIFVKVSNKAICMTGITVLSVTYLASTFAAGFQVYYGTKHIKFPQWLDKWMRDRKQLGVVGFLLILVHVIMSILIMSPTYLRSWYHDTSITIPHNLTEPIKYSMVTWMTWKGEAACLTGILSFLAFCLIAVSTFPSVSASLNWREWRFIQSRLGHVALFLAVIHVIVMGAPGWIKKPWAIYSSITFLSSIIPWITILSKLCLCFPCIDRYVTRVRKGWERTPSNCKGPCASPRKKNDGYVSVEIDTSCQHSGSACACPRDTVPMVSIEEKHCGCKH